MPALLEVVRDALAPRYEVERELGAGGMATVFLAGDILRVPLTGGEAEVMTTLPFDVPGSSLRYLSCTANEREGRLVLLCNVPETVSDAWMIENFDPDIR